MIPRQVLAGGDLLSPPVTPKAISLLHQSRSISLRQRKMRTLLATRKLRGTGDNLPRSRHNQLQSLALFHSEETKPPRPKMANLAGKSKNQKLGKRIEFNSDPNPHTMSLKSTGRYLGKVLLVRHKINHHYRVCPILNEMLHHQL